MARFLARRAACGRHVRVALAAAVLAAGLGGGVGARGGEKGPKAGKPAAKAKWISLFDGKKLGEWEIVKKDDFEMHGPVKVDKGCIVLGTGMSFTGIVRPGKFPTEGFEIEAEATRRQGVDIFCGLTFPVGKEHCTLVLGGWGDSVVGLSSIDDQNASDNQYVVIRGFKNKQWYRVRLRVTKTKILAWIDDKKIIEVPRGKHKFTVYEELKAICPVGFFSWETEGAVRKIRYRTLEGKP